MTGALPRALVVKEARALAPVWLATAVTIVAAAAAAEAWAPNGRLPIGVPGMRLLAIAAYLIGATALGALSMGHEFTHRTLGGLLAQPIDRRRVLLVKQVVLAGWLLALGLLAWGLLSWSDDTGAWRLALADRTAWWGGSLLVLPILRALCIAPPLTLLCRNAIAGLVFTMAVPAACSAAASIVIFAREGMTQAAWQAGETLSLTMLWSGVTTAAVAGLVASGRLFARAEAIDGSDGAWMTAVIARDTASSAAPQVHRPMGLLFAKELRLQVWVAAVAALYMLVWVAVSLWRPEADLVATLLSMATVLYAIIVALFAGSLASAEERGLGTVEWQALLPYPVWRAWAVKVGTAFGLVLVLAVGLPALLSFVGPVGGEWRATPVFRLTWWSFNGAHWFFLAGATIVAASLYVSSLSGSGLRALLVALPIVLIGRLLVGSVADTANRSLSWALGPWVRLNDVFATRRFTPDESRAFELIVLTSDLLAVALALGFIGALLWLACRNHHTTQSQTGVPRRQVAGLAIYLMIASFTAGAASPVLLAAWLSRGP